MKVNFISDLDADRRGAQTSVLGPAADVILESLPRLGANHFVTGNDAVHVEQAAPTLSVVPGGALVLLSDRAEIWPKLATWGLALAVADTAGARPPLSFRFFDRAGQRVLEAHVAPHGRALERACACVARWRSPWCRPPCFGERAQVPANTCETIERAADRARSAAAFEILPAVDLHALFDAVARRDLDTRLAIHNAGATYVLRGGLPVPRRSDAILHLRDADVDVAIDESLLAELRLVRLRVHGRQVAALEAFDGRGELVFSLAGARDAAGFQAPAWSALIAELGRGRWPLAALS